MISERKMDYLLKIAQLQSISAAAKALYVSQPALSQLISSLEKTYNTKIFEYKNNRLIPTYSGELLIETFQKQKMLENALLGALDDARQSKSGRISIGISSGRAPMFLSIVLPDFQKIYPHVQLTVNTQSLNGFESMIASGQLDLAFVMNKADVPTDVADALVCEPLFEYECLLAAPPSHPIAESARIQPDWRLRPPVNLSDFQDETFIQTVKNDRHRSWERSLYAPYNFHPNYTILLSDESALFDLVQADLGFALIQDYVAFSRKCGAFFRLDRSDSKATLCVIYRKNVHLTEAMQYFIQLVKDHTKKNSFFKF
ncbi:MAG: LysR family transcriptional regulator [Eubacteriales bacterium]|nr:LysR family transcriptional regulator [Eubacteriales bacterium]